MSGLAGADLDYALDWLPRPLGVYLIFELGLDLLRSRAHFVCAALPER